LRHAARELLELKMTFPRLAAALLAPLLAFPALAQTAAPKPASPASAAPVAAEPQNTSATYGDWMLRCQRVGEGAGARKICEIAESIRDGQTRQPVAEIALAQLNKADRIRLTVHVASNISLPSIAKFTYREAHGVELAWRRCASVGCFADAALTDDQIKIFRVQDEPGGVEFYDADGRPQKFPVSFRGLGQAMDALAKE
jgi:invasion protein IalB